jgi:C4-dicarboxylate-specific signal transduction histidine kinase
MISNYNKLLLDTDQFSIKDFRKSNQQIIDQVNFMNETSDSFRNFFSEKKQNQEFYLYKTVENIIKILSHKIKQSSVNISKDYDENISLFGIENDFSQVILSIINNALDKFENNTYESNMYIDIKNIDGKKVLRIRDNGGLINEELLPTKLFNRHVTTKKTGTGLGLAICKSVIRNHFDGDIFAYNENGLACFEIRI